MTLAAVRFFKSDSKPILHPNKVTMDTIHDGVSMCPRFLKYVPGKQILYALMINYLPFKFTFKHLHKHFF